jgi:methylated-DNA-[protein]-cysteine S-methyltransferase
MMSTPIRYTVVPSPVGPLLLARDERALCALQFAAGPRPAEPRRDWIRNDEAFGDVTRQLREYFEGGRRAFEIALAPQGTAFQRSVWTELCRIPYGGTISYAKLATRIGNPRAVRAVGLANGANPIAIVIPCHRVIGANGTLTGYGGGLGTKRHLLDLERTALLGESGPRELQPSLVGLGDARS